MGLSRGWSRKGRFSIGLLGVRQMPFTRLCRWAVSESIWLFVRPGRVTTILLTLGGSRLNRVALLVSRGNGRAEALTCDSWLLTKLTMMTLGLCVARQCVTVMFRLFVLMTIRCSPWL